VVGRGIDHNRKGGAFEIEQPKVGPEGELSGGERVKAHRGHGGVKVTGYTRVLILDGATPQHSGHFFHNDCSHTES
jgi:hypothetical protein